MVRRGAESIGRHDVRGDLDASLDRVLHGVEDGVLTLAVRAEGVARYAPELREVPLEAADPVDAVLDPAAVHHHGHTRVAKYWSR